MKIDKDTQLGNLYAMWQESDRENAIKLEQILDLEQLLYELRGWEDENLGPCWLTTGCKWVKNNTLYFELIHSPECERARKATEPHWKKP